MIEVVVLVNDENEEIGVMPKLDAHHSNTPLHRGFSSYVFNTKGEFLLTQRARMKKVWPGIWTNSCCGHPGLNETVEDAVNRRLDYELGLTPEQMEVVLPDFRYRVTLHGIVENEICPVYLVRVSGEPKPNPKEVEEYRWLPWEEYIADVAANPSGYSEWSVMQVAQLKNNPLIKKYTKPL